MCGICGILGDAPPWRVERMVSAMRHRGPDDYGVFRDDGVTLGMARLAIIDITSLGHQPMGTPDGSIHIVYNGEAYNFRSEGEILRKKGYSFTSTSDTEVVLRMYEHYGDDFLNRLRGMFALALYDRRKGKGRERLLLARDPIGIKPLLYARAGSRFLFSSEIKSLLASGLVDRNIDPEAVRLLLTQGSIPQPRTILSAVRMLPPAHRLIVENGTERLERYWKMETGRRRDLRDRPYEELVHEVRSALEESVRLQMISDVPLGAFLSGGVDSSLLVAMMSRMSDHKVKTFSVGFGAEGAHMDETDDAERIAKFIGTDHKRVLVTGKDVRDRIVHIASSLDQPSVDGVNSYFVSLAARQEVTVAISGTGGDELFAGYPWFQSMADACEDDRLHPAAAAAKGALASFSRSPFFDPWLAGSLRKRIEKGRALSGFLPRYARCYEIFGTRDAAKYLSHALRKVARIGREPARDILGDELPGANPVDRVTALCLRGYTQNQLLRDIDAVSMAHSLEVRVPFLDPVLVDLALSLPSGAKLGGPSRARGRGAGSYRETGAKRILVDAGRGLLPEGMDLQLKRGFGMPFDSWLSGPLKDVLEDVLSSAAVRARGLFDVEEVGGLKEAFLRGRSGWARPWLLMMTELWCREVLDLPADPKGSGAGSVPSRIPN
ncbi:MAG: asparagine synthase (glutamine-hydrolyzing) [Euryarchaeota archaeon]|nr:asparagine synthase (glutamine-hydrolyzing) [Euryarchaeota archaeon]